MAEVVLRIGDRTHRVTCRDGEEAQLERLGRLLDSKAAAASRAAGQANGERMLLFIALMLADALDEAERRPAGDVENALLARVADRLEAVAAALENGAENA